MRRRKSGVVSFMIDGVSLQATADAEIEASANEVMREDVGNGYFTEKKVSPYIKVQMELTDNFPMNTLRTGTNITVQAVFDSRTSVTLIGATVIGETVVKGGIIDFEFRGEKIKWSV